MMGHVNASYDLGALEEEAGNMDRAVKHWMISASAGDDDSLKEIRQCSVNGHATKDDFEKVLRAHKKKQKMSGRVISEMQLLQPVVNIEYQSNFSM